MQFLPSRLRCQGRTDRFSADQTLDDDNLCIHCDVEYNLRRGVTSTLPSINSLRMTDFRETSGQSASKGGSSFDPIPTRHYLVDNKGAGDALTLLLFTEPHEEHATVHREATIHSFASGEY